MLALLGLTLAFALPAEARDPTFASYSSDADRMFWFVHITDLHVGWPVSSAQNLKLVADTAHKIVKPSFIVATGDLTDLGSVVQSWQTYRQILTAAGHTTQTFFDLPGNHDGYLDSKLTNYLKYSIQGAATGKSHHAWRLDFSFGSYQFIGLDTSTGSLPQGEASFALQALKSDPSVRLTFACGHHPLSEIDAGGAFRTSLAQEKVLAYFFGHTHKTFDGGREFGSDGVLMWITETLGKPLSTLLEAEYAIFAVDNDALSIRPVTIKLKNPTEYELPWPIAVITAPVDAKLGGTNPYAYAVSRIAANNPIRALVFSDAAITKVTAKIDGGAPIPLTNVSGSLWSGTFDGAGLASTSSHTLAVTAESAGKTDTHEIAFAASAASSCSDGQDNDGDKLVDYPADPGCTGLFDTDERNPPGVGPDGGAARDAGVRDARDAGVSSDRGGDAGEPDQVAPVDAARGEGPTTPGAGCGCSAGARPSGSPTLLALLLPASVLALRARRGRRPRERSTVSRRQ